MLVCLLKLMWDLHHRPVNKKLMWNGRKNLPEEGAFFNVSGAFLCKVL